jgi:O-methyltransferase
MRSLIMVGKVSVLGRFKSILYHKILAPPVARLGCRPPFGVPLDAFSLAGHFGYDEEEMIKRAASRVARSTMTHLEQLAALWHQVRYLDRCGIGGSLVECGVWKGGAAGMMALAHLALGPAATRPLELFDSFRGLPEPRGSVDGRKALRLSGRRGSGRLEPIARLVSPLAESRHLLEDEIGYPSELLRFHSGWFQDTLPAAAPTLGAIALLRLDGDWYESTRVALENLYPLVAPGGVVVIDDYGHWDGCRRAVDEFVSALREPVLLNHIDYSGRYWLRQAARDGERGVVGAGERVR